MRISEDLSGRGLLVEQAGALEEAPRLALKAPVASAPKKAKSKARAKRRAKETPVGALPILYMLSPQKYMSPFDCNMAIDSGYSVVLPYDNVAVGDVTGLVQDAMFSRPPKSATGIFIGGKDITVALEMMKAARGAMMAPFTVSVFADPGGSFTTAGAMAAVVERVLARSFARTWKGVRLSVFGATGVVGFASAVLAANAGARVRIVAHESVEPLVAMSRTAKELFGADLEPVEGQTDALKSRILAATDVVFTAGPAGVNIITRRQLARAPGLLIAADVNAVKPFGVEGLELNMDGAPLPGSTTLGVGALTIGDVKYRTQAGLFRRMLTSAEPLDLDFRDGFVLAREIVSGVRPPGAK